MASRVLLWPANRLNVAFAGHCQSACQCVRISDMTSPGVDGERELAVETPKKRGRIPADTLSNRLMLARSMAGHLSIREAAELCGYGRGAWTNWERGARPLDVLDVVSVISEQLDCDKEWLLFGGALTPSRGRPTNRAALDTDEYTRRAVQPTSHQSVRPPDGRPKVRTDSRGSTSHPGIGRRAAPIR